MHGLPLLLGEFQVGPVPHNSYSSGMAIVMETSVNVPAVAYEGNH